MVETPQAGTGAVEGTASPEAAAAAATAAAAAAAATKPWYDGKLDAEGIGYLSNRGWNTLKPEDVALNAIKAHREAEKHLGVPASQLLRLPKEKTDADGWRAVKEQLGAPKDAKDYDFSLAGDKADPAFVEFFRGAANKIGLNKEDASALAKDFVEFAAKQDADEIANKSSTVGAEKQALMHNWGQNAPANILIAQRAAASLGMTPEAISALEGQVGYKAVMEMFYNVGTKIGEDKFITSHQTGGVMTRDGAISRIAELKADRAWTAKYLQGDTAAKREMADLMQIGYGGEDQR